MPRDPRARAARPRSDSLVSLVRRVTDAERHRGPDGSGLWQSPGQEAVFGHRRLAIIDLSESGAQPMVDPASGCAVTFNGEIYNYRALRAELQAAGDRFASASDTEVLLKAYARWGVSAFERLRGIFALAVWDPRGPAVHLVRDPLGIKPLYWTTVRDADSGEEVVLFASELRALLASGAAPRRLDPASVATYLWQGFVVGPGTIVEGVRLLPAATVLTIEPGGAAGRPNALAERAYWQLPSSPARRSPEEARAELVETVRMQLVADVPLGVFLSGGIDSSAVAALASEAAPGAVHTFTIGFEEAPWDETRHAQRVAESLGTRHETVVLRAGEFHEALDDAFTAIDQPTFDGINTYYVSRAARRAGMTVALAGTGGDEVFGGYPSFAEVPRAVRAGAWLPYGTGGPARRLADASVAHAARLAQSVWWSVLGIASPQTRWAKLAEVVQAAPDLVGVYQAFYELFTRATQARLASPAVRAAQARLEHGLPASVAARWRERTRGSELLHGVSLLELMGFIGERLLRDTDAASMAVSLEVRVPLLDHVLVETLAGIDPARRFLPLQRKQLLRDLALARLAPEIFERPKAGFVLPIEAWARKSLRARMDALFRDEAALRSAGLDSRPAGVLWRSYLDGRPGLYWSRVWAIFVLADWCRRHDVRLESRD